MKVAAYQAPLLPAGSMEALGLIRDRVKWCETEGVDILCCPEAVLGGLADDAQCHAEASDVLASTGGSKLKNIPGTLDNQDSCSAPASLRLSAAAEGWR